MARNPHWRVPSTWRSERYRENLRLSPTMKAALRAAAECGTVVATPGTLKALIDRDLCDGAGRLNPYGEVIAVSTLALPAQCRVLNLPLATVECDWQGRPEPAALQLLTDAGGWGYADEGRVLHALIHGLVLPRLYSTALDSPQWGADRARSWFYMGYGGYNDLLDVDPNLAAKMLSDIAYWDRAAFLQTWQALMEWNMGNEVVPHPASRIGQDTALMVLDTVGRDRLYAIAKKVFEEPFSYWSGWPDLMLLDSEGSLRFVEVKTTDTLHYSQIITMPAMRDAAGLDMSVLRLKRTTQHSG